MDTRVTRAAPRPAPKRSAPLLQHPRVSGRTRDQWAEWLAERRFGSPDVRNAHLERLMRRRDDVLDRGRAGKGDVVLDAGCGEGLIGFGALARGARSVVFTDVSEDLLAFCREAARELGVETRCRFVRASADDLAGVDDGSVNVVATRSVLIYVEDKQAAFREFFRVLRPGGRITIFEPINRVAGDSFLGYDLGPLGEVGDKIAAVYTVHEADSTVDPMLNFDERDLLRYAEEAGFFPLALTLEVEVRPTDAEPFDALLNRAANPLSPTLAEAMAEVLTPVERERVVTYLRPLVESGGGVWRMAYASLSGDKPAR